MPVKLTYTVDIPGIINIYFYRSHVHNRITIILPGTKCSIKSKQTILCETYGITE